MIGIPAPGRGLAVAAAAVSVALALAGCGGDDSGQAPTANSLPEVIDCPFDKPAVRPANLILACADLGLRVEEIQWKTWGPETAEGDGVQKFNTCDPNCAEGHFDTKQVHIVLSDVVEPGHVYTKATTSVAGGETLIRPLTKR
ncbi:hypothetical protein BJY24_007361 [Nocardia transvalensis]|uniref:LppP/LprE lipoprotein n=1 Tax=Nocardia transvalensis TaxID=37333 RepID=A0A7W9PML5_9NOCA|nr:hypothetical protein [Nocardia transvalensis]MBB5918449.1 hypothetical protein [Nocardia transvalensis]